jgi:NAD-dependent dihydropyrimidine dehydrogenase PreA subunit
MPEPVVNEEKCTGCWTCVEICPMDVFEKAEEIKKVKVSDKECIGCRACEIQCPEEVIKVND